MTRGKNTNPLVVVANRLPVRREGERWQASSGGLVTALSPVMSGTTGAWVGWDDADDIPVRVEGLDVDLSPVKLTPEQVEGHYHGFSNRTIWPLFHDLIAQPVIDRSYWEQYVEVNQKFAEAACALKFDHPEPPIFWVQDYHLMLAPQMIRKLRPDAIIGFFLHIPFPPPELMSRLPWREEILAGLLSADVVSFHTERYRENFVNSCMRVFDDLAVRSKRLMLPEGRRIRTAAHAISIDAAAFSDLAVHDETQRELDQLRTQFEGKHVFLGVDRLDYTKGIRHRLQAISLLLERREDLRGKVAFVQVAVPSRDDVQEYRDLRAEIESEVGRINGRFTEPGQDVPVHYLYRGVSEHRLAAYYRLADVMCVTPLKDGMNLVAKEFAICQDAGGEAGVLLLSEFAGAWHELSGGAMGCNPFDVEGLSMRMEQAMTLPVSERRKRIATMANTVRRRDVFNWVNLELAEIARATAQPKTAEVASLLGTVQ